MSNKISKAKPAPTSRAAKSEIADLITTSVVFESPVYSELQRRATTEERSISKIVNRALKAHFEAGMEAV